MTAREPGPDSLLSFFVDGWARPQGSKKAWSHEGTAKAFMREQVDPEGRWRRKVAAAAHRAARAAGLREPISEPVKLGAYFFFETPKVPKFEDWPAARNVGDLEKLVRATNDALQEGLDSLIRVGVLVDDALVVSFTEDTGKYWARGGQKPGVFMWLEPAGRGPQWYQDGKVWE